MSADDELTEGAAESSEQVTRTVGPGPGEPAELSFEQGYERLQAIAARLGAQDVPVAEMCDLFAEGKGLERALIEFLDTQRARVAEIEAGTGVKAFKITGAQ